MPDYDVAALALAVPPASAPVASYYPAVSVRNNGIHPAPVTGTLRIHDKAAGTLVATLSLLSNSNLNPGATASVPATTAWSPATSDIGKQFLFSAEVTTPLDQVPGNNQLSPVTVLVTAEPPTPPPVTVRHAAQHEHDGADEIDVSGLPGVLAAGQYPKPHKYTHGIDGDDQLNVDGLPGELHDNQPALAHGNERHTAAYTTEGALTAHNNSQAAHANSANLEHTAKKGAASGYAGLNPQSKVPPVNLGGIPATEGSFLREDGTWQPPAGGSPGPHATTHELAGDDQLDVSGLSGVLADPQPVRDHAGHHSAIGADPIDLTDLSGVCGDQQNPVSHAGRHQFEGDDVLDVNGLAGVLANGQTPKAHAASHEFLGADAVDIGGLPGNPGKRGQQDGLASLDSLTLVPAEQLGTGQPGQATFLRGDRTWNSIPASPPSAHAATHEAAGDDELGIQGLSGILAERQHPQSALDCRRDILVNGEDPETTLAQVDLPAGLPLSELGVIRFEALGHAGVAPTPVARRLRLYLLPSLELCGELEYTCPDPSIGFCPHNIVGLFHLHSGFSGIMGGFHVTHFEPTTGRAHAFVKLPPFTGRSINHLAPWGLRVTLLIDPLGLGSEYFYAAVAALSLTAL